MSATMTIERKYVRVKDYQNKFKIGGVDIVVNQIDDKIASIIIGKPGEAEFIISVSSPQSIFDAPQIEILERLII